MSDTTWRVTAPMIQVRGRFAFGVETVLRKGDVLPAEVDVAHVAELQELGVIEANE
jgi:hypothetical protein